MWYIARHAVADNFSMIRAPRLLACPSSSGVPEPSPNKAIAIAVKGTAGIVDHHYALKASAAAKPATDNGVTAASAPPQIIA